MQNWILVLIKTCLDAGMSKIEIGMFIYRLFGYKFGKPSIVLEMINSVIEK